MRRRADLLPLACRRPELPLQKAQFQRVKGWLVPRAGWRSVLIMH